MTPSKTSEELAEAFGYLYKEEVKLLKKLAIMLYANPVIVNIGAGAGTSALAFAEAREDAQIYTVDKSEGGPLGGLEGERNAFDGAGRKYPHQILGDSFDVGLEWNKGPIDLLFVDGDHTEMGLSRDIDAWLPHVKEGGYIAFHDYDAIKWAAVKRVVDYKMKKYKSIAHVDTIKVFLV